MDLMLKNLFKNFLSIIIYMQSQIGVKTYKPFAVGNKSMFGSAIGNRIYPTITANNRVMLPNMGNPQILNLGPFAPIGLNK
jgi:hypothetical protein